MLRKICFLGLLIVFQVPGESSAAEPYTVTVEPTEIGATEVTARVRTNIPGVIEVMLSLDLAGQAPDDVYIGASKRVRLVNGTAIATVGEANLPAGSYELEVAFYPRWGPQDAQARAAGLNEAVRAAVEIELGGGGSAAADAQRSANGQRWVMENVTPGMRWDLASWEQRFGNARRGEVTGLNPRVIDALYFEEIDMTIFVNKVRGEVSHWRLGLQTR